MPPRSQRRNHALTHEETVSNAAIALFGGIETVEGMIGNALPHLLADHVTAREVADVDLAFARGPHFCIGAHLARLEVVTAARALLSTLPGLRLDAGYPVQVRGLVFRKPLALYARWEPPSASQ